MNGSSITGALDMQPAIQPSLTYAQLVAVVEKNENLTNGVRRNVVAVVRRAASLMPGVAGESASIDLPALTKRLGKLTPAHLKLSKASFSAFKSNLFRALRLAGFQAIPGRHQAKLKPAWQSAIDLLEDPRTKRDISRFVHFGSEAGWSPGEIGEEHLQRFGIALATRCAPSKTRKLLRNLVKAWNSVSEKISDWPCKPLQGQFRPDWFYGRGWSVFPASLVKDIDKYLAHRQATPDIAFLDLEDDTAPIEARTAANYRDGFKRAASIMVANGVDPTELTGLAALVDLPRAKAVLGFLSKRLQRTDGGQLNLIAMLLFVAARDWVYPPHHRSKGNEHVVAKLKQWFENTRLKKKGMSERTQQRLSAFNDPQLLHDYLALPTMLVKEAQKSAPGVDPARLVRMAVFIAVSLDTLLRPGNVVSLDLDQNLQRSPTGKQPDVFVLVPKTKNGLTFHGKLRPQTVSLLDLYVCKYRQFHLQAQCSWLFPVSGERHWPEGRACQALKDLCAKRLGADVTPHLHRALGGKIILTANPGALVDVQNALLHKSFATTRASYIHEEAADVQHRYHAILTARGKSRFAEIK